jgi:TRAP-type C4-dicarboxylate transport system permease small subunit
MASSPENGGRGGTAPAGGEEVTETGAEILADDAPVDLSDLRWADAPAFVFFWVLAFVVFLQFFTRYILNDSLGWTEEIARYLLVCVAFVGAIMAVRKNSHISVEFFYRYLPYKARRWLITLVDLSRIAFFIAMTVICIKLANKTNQKMASIELSKAVIYWIVAAAFLAMTFYSLRVALRHWKTKATTPSPEDSHAQVMD